MPGPGGGFLRAGRVGRPVGLDGSFYVSEANIALLAVGTRVLLGGHKLRVAHCARNANRFVLRLQGRSDRDAAEALRGCKILVAREDAPELGPEEWWAEDLEGCLVHDGTRHLGVVRRLLVLPSCEVLEVSRNDGRRDLLVPLVSDAVRAIDVERQSIDVDGEFLDAG